MAVAISAHHWTPCGAEELLVNPQNHEREQIVLFKCEVLAICYSVADNGKRSLLPLWGSACQVWRYSSCCQIQWSLTGSYFAWPPSSIFSQGAFFHWLLISLLTYSPGFSLPLWLIHLIFLCLLFYSTSKYWDVSKRSWVFFPHLYPYILFRWPHSTPWL